MPAATYSVGNNYFSRIVLSYNGSFIQSGVSAPIYQEFAIENATAYGNYARIVTVPTVRLLVSTIDGENYYEFYLPSLVEGSYPYLSQALTLTGNGLNMAAPSGSIGSIKITATPSPNIISPLNPALDFSVNNSFFDFTSSSESIPINSNSLVEIYNGNVTVAIGLT